MKALIIVFSPGLTVFTAGCGNTAPSRGEQVNNCMEKNSPGECDRQVNRRSSSY